MFTKSHLTDLRTVDIASVDKSLLVDIQTINIDVSAPIADRAQKFCEQIKNPYAFRVGDMAMKIEYAHNGRTLHDAVAKYLEIIR